MPSMTSSLLPDWLRLTWALLLAGVAMVHIGHVLAMSGQRQCWHAWHTIMAVGMVVMYLQPHTAFPLLYQVGLALFALLSAGLVAITVSIRRREGVLNPLWAALVVDVLAMTYMFVPGSLRPAALTSVLVLYLGVQAIAWSAGLWSRVAVSSRPATVAAEAGTDGVLPPEGQGKVIGLNATSAFGVRLTLAVMATGMAYMLAAM